MRTLQLLLVALPVLGATATSRQRTPQDVARELLDADRAFAASAIDDDYVSALARTFARDVVLPDRPASSFARGRDAAIALLRRDTLAASSHFQWTPIRAGVSGDASHGFTYGYTTLTRADGSKVLGKYVAYWVKEDGEWRVDVYRRVGRPPGEVSLDERPPALPPRLTRPTPNDPGHATMVAELAQTERNFSRDATGGPTIGEAFARYGDPTAANVGGMAEFTFGPAAIGASVQASIGSDTRITWGPDETRVASSGDVGVTIGIIRIERRGPSGALEEFRIPYFTIWRRDDRSKPWRYVAE